MRVKIVGFGHFVTDTRFKFEGAFAKDLKKGDVLGYLDPDTMEVVENPEIGERPTKAKAETLHFSRGSWVLI